MARTRVVHHHEVGVRPSGEGRGGSVAVTGAEEKGAAATAHLDGGEEGWRWGRLPHVVGHPVTGLAGAAAHRRGRTTARRWEHRRLKHDARGLGGRRSKGARVVTRGGTQEVLRLLIAERGMAGIELLGRLSMGNDGRK